MRCVNRFKEFRDTDLDTVLIKIRNGSIKSGKYANMIKVDGNAKIKDGYLFKDVKNDGKET
jgi:hypothetical protein